MTPETPREAGRQAQSWRDIIPPISEREEAAFIIEELLAGNVGAQARAHAADLMARLAAPAPGLPAAEGLREALRSVLSLWDESAADPDDVDRDVLEPARAALAAADRAERGLPLDVERLARALTECGWYRTDYISTERYAEQLADAYNAAVPPADPLEVAL